MRLLQCTESDLFSTESTARLIDLCHQCHVTDLLVQIHRYDGWIIETNYCDITPFRLNNLLPFDYLRQQATDISIHPQILIGTYEKWIGSLAHIKNQDLSDWSVKRVNSNLKNWLNFGLPEVRAWLAEMSNDLEQRNDLDFFSLDYIRYEPQAMETGAFSASDITLTVQEIRNAIPQNTSLIADVAPAYKNDDYQYGWHNVGCGQDWPEWLRNELLSFAMPMNYVVNQEEYIIERYINNSLVNDLLPKIFCAITPFGYDSDSVSPETWESMVDANLNNEFELSLFNSHLLFQDQAYIDILNDRPPGEIPEPPPSEPQKYIITIPSITIEIPPITVEAHAIHD